MKIYKNLGGNVKRTPRPRRLEQLVATSRVTPRPRRITKDEFLQKQEH